MTAKTFRDLGVDDALCDALEAKGITHPFPIQELALPLALDGHDLIGQARTGTGKTLAFGLPLLQGIETTTTTTQALVIVPTRELCLQVHDDLQIGTATGITTISVYGGTPYEEQTAALTGGVHVVVGTPGRLLDHLERGNLDLSAVRTLVLDEADEMLDMGFLPDVERLIEACGTDRHGMLFSATMPTEIVKLARRYLTNPTFTRADSQQHETAPNVEQHFFSVHRMDKPRVLARILQSPERGGAYVFVRTKMMADRLVGDLEDLGIPAVPVHGDLRQQTREKNLDRFRSGKADVLVCTEVAARGIDVAGVTHVINYDCPDDEKMYLHRIGRTARAGAAGAAVTFAEFNEADRLNVIRKAVGATETEVKQIFSTSDELTELFDLPAERPWDHLATQRGKDAGRGGGRRGQTDGRSKNRSDRQGGREHGNDRRRAEGKARTRDDRDPKQRPRSDRDGEQRARSDRDRHDDGRRQQTDRGRGEGAARTRDDAGGRAGGGTRDDGGGRDTGATRTRTRTRTRSGQHGTAARGKDDANAREPARGRGADAARDRDGDTSTATGGGRSRARRDRGGGREVSNDQRSGDRQRDRGRPRTDAQDTGAGGASGRSRSSARGSAAGPSSDGPDARSSGDGSNSRPRRTRGSGGAPSESGGGGTSRRGGQSGRRDTRGKGGGQGGGRGDGRRGDREPGDPAPKVVRKGRDARGEGEPHLARRVHVDHLP